MSGGQKNRGFLRRFLYALDHLDREEKGYPPVNRPSATMPPGGSSNHAQQHVQFEPTSTATTNTDLLIPSNDKLLVFRALTGIDSAPILFAPGNHRRTAENVGIYTRVVQAEAWAVQRYRFFTILINVCLGIQIVVAAALTALGAASGPNSAVTAFGAINTIMAGILTYLKGSGLPDRMKVYQKEWRNVREYIEQREREFCLEDCELDVQEEIITIESMYEEIKQQVGATKSGGENRSVPSDGGCRHCSPRLARAASKSRKRVEPESPISVPERSLEKH